MLHLIVAWLGASWFQIELDAWMLIKYAFRKRQKFICQYVFCIVPSILVIPLSLYFHSSVILDLISFSSSTIKKKRSFITFPTEYYYNLPIE
jgi:hypothetical protein